MGAQELTRACEPERLIAKLEMAGGMLGTEDRHALRVLCDDIRAVSAHGDIIREGDSTEHVHLMIEGWAARYKIVPDGGRQITAFLIPGDLCDAHIAILKAMDHGIVSLTRARVAYIPQRVMEALPIDRPKLARALWWATLVDEAVLRSWIVNLGRRDGYERVAHLLCELQVRLRNVGLVHEDHFALPLTQEVLADALGLTPVHINRVLQRLRAEELITLKGGTLTVLDGVGLGKAAGFDPNYLHARKPGG
jgi:CRP-like cAMP-binding protein